MNAPGCVLTLAFALPLLAVAADAPRQLKIYQKAMPVYPTTGPGSDGGCVTLKYTILHTGLVGDVTVVEAKPEALAAPSVAAMKLWVFQSFPPSEAEVSAVQTFNYAPDKVRMPENAIRPSLLALGEDGTLGSAGCGAAKPAVTQAKPAAPATRSAKAKKP